MLSKIVPLRARVSAEIANKWFLAGVRAHVDHQARALTELLIALVALEPLAVAKVHVLVTQAQRGKLICTHLASWNNYVIYYPLKTKISIKP